jgi:predicted RNA-binding Zn ribbon-like protein
MVHNGTTTARRSLVGGALCLDFANTAAWHASARPKESLTRYKDLVAWCRRAGAVDAVREGRLLREARRRPAAATAALRRAIGLREVIYRVVVSVMRGRRPDADDLDAFNRALASALRHSRVAPGRRGLVWCWDDDGRTLDGMLGPIVESAAELLTSGRRGRIGQCADDRGCGWLFLDTTKNRSRRWCEMADCGNRAKAQRHYWRTRGRGAVRRT